MTLTAPFPETELPMEAGMPGCLAISLRLQTYNQETQMKKAIVFAMALAFSGMSLAVQAEEDFAPYGSAKAIKPEYAPQKMAFSVMGTAEETPALMAQLAGVLKQAVVAVPKGSEIEVVVIGSTVGAFAKENYAQFQPQIDAIVDLTKGAIPLKVRLCGNSVKGAGYKPEDMHGFAEVVPAGYLELASLGQQGYTIGQIAIVNTKGARYAFRPDLKPQAPATPAASATPATCKDSKC
jgi:intracellular sulfur oxidation DsrE/DsrF family protein